MIERNVEVWAVSPSGSSVKLSCIEQAEMLLKILPDTRFEMWAGPWKQLADVGSVAALLAAGRLLCDGGK